jgi:hypothetical protein
MTEWLARRVGDRVLCGRQVAGRYVCQGEIAEMVWTRVQLPGLPDEWVPVLGPGFTKVPGTNHWRQQRRAARQTAEGRAARGNLRGSSDPATFEGMPEDRVPVLKRVGPVPLDDWTRDCPHCGAIARVRRDLLKS